MKRDIQKCTTKELLEELERRGAQRISTTEFGGIEIVKRQKYSSQQSQRVLHHILVLDDLSGL